MVIFKPEIPPFMHNYYPFGLEHKGSHILTKESSNNSKVVK